MYLEADVQSLLALCRANEESPRRFDLGTYARDEPCGTTACLAGEFCLTYPRDRLRLVRAVQLDVGTLGLSQNFGILLAGENERDAVSGGFLAISQRFGISHGMAQWLFSHKEIARDARGMRRFDRFKPCFGDVPFRSGAERANDRAAAVRRVRKFLYYILHKRELLHEADGCVRETARRQEGNHLVTQAVAKRVREACHA